MALHVLFDVEKLQIWITVYIYMYEKRKKTKNLYKFKFSVESKGGLNNKVLEKFKRPRKGCSWKLTHSNLNIYLIFRGRWNFMNYVSL